MTHQKIGGFHQSLGSQGRRICDLLRAEIDRHLPEAESKIWHAHPVWCLDASQIDRAALAGWIAQARVIQWDYKNIYKRQGRLERLL